MIHVPGGGTHHGLPGRANGFCYLNDVVLGIKVLLRAGLSRIVYVDLDAHHCDGVELAFTGDPGVRMISVHEEGRWPFTGALEDHAGGSAFNLPVPKGYNDSEARAVLHGLILPRVAEFRPEAIVLQCGADSLTEDPLSRLTLSNRAYLEALTRAAAAGAPRAGPGRRRLQPLVGRSALDGDLGHAFGPGAARPPARRGAGRAAGPDLERWRPPAARPGAADHASRSRRAKARSGPRSATGWRVLAPQMIRAFLGIEILPAVRGALTGAAVPPPPAAQGRAGELPPDPGLPWRLPRRRPSDRT